MKKIILASILVAACFALVAQVSFPKPSFNPFSSTSSSLLNMENMKMSHSMGFEAGTSSIGDGYYLSRYTNHIMYKFNPKLELDLELNFVNYGGMKTSSKLSFDDNNRSQVIPEFSLRYKPTDSILIQVEMNRGLNYNYARNYWADRWLDN